MIGARSGLSPRERTILLLALAAASAVVYAGAFTLTWPLWRLYGQPQADYAWFGRYTRESQALYIGAFAVLFGLQYLAYRLVRGAPGAISLELLLAGQLVFGVLNVWIYPVAALDLYDYLMYGRIVLVYGENPFLVPPSAFPDPLVAYSPWPNERSVYGPAWQLLSLIPTAWAGNDILRGLVAFKLLGLLAYLACSALIWLLLSRLLPALAAAGTLLFAWNPLLQFELVGNGHNDVVMVLLLLLALVALVHERRWLVPPIFALAILTKLLVAALGPVILYGLLRGPGTMRRKLEALFLGGAFALALTVGFYLPFWEGSQTLYFLTRGNWFTASFPTMLRELLRQSMPFEEAGRVAATLVGLGFAGYSVLRLLALWRDERADDPHPPTRFAAQISASPTSSPASGRGGDWSDLPVGTATALWARWGSWLHAAHDVTFVYLTFATLWWQPWYLVWLVALAALLPSRLIHERTLLFCFGGTLNYVVFKYIWPVFQPMTYPTIMGISVLMIFGLPMLHLACTAGVGASRTRPPAAPAPAA